MLVIRCDRPNCYARIETSWPKTTKARAEAARQGWTTVAGLIDLCGRPDQAGIYTTGGENWRGHAHSEDHYPTVKPVRNRQVALSCRCGWKYESPHHHDLGSNTLYRSSAAFRWAQHVEEAVGQAGTAATA